MPKIKLTLTAWADEEDGIYELSLLMDQLSCDLYLNRNATPPFSDDSFSCVNSNAKYTIDIVPDKPENQVCGCNPYHVCPECKDRNSKQPIPF